MNLRGLRLGRFWVLLLVSLGRGWVTRLELGSLVVKLSLMVLLYVVVDNVVHAIEEEKGATMVWTRSDLIGPHYVVAANCV